MLAKLKALFSEVASGTPNEPDGHTTRLAAAALLIDVCRADYADDPREMLAVRSALARCFGLSSEQLDTLVTLAADAAAEATSSYAFTRTLNEHLSDPEKFALLHAMWEVAYADGSLDRYEEHLIRKIAELLYIPHREFIGTKLAAQKRAQRS